MKKLLLILIFLTIGSNTMATPEIEKKLFTELAAGYGKSTTASNKAIAAAYKAAADAIVIPPAVVTPPVVTPPIVTPPTNSAWPKDVAANPTGSKKPMASVVGDLVTQKDGDLIDAKNVTGKIIVKHNNVKITNFVTTGVWKDPGKTGLIMEDGKIDGQNVVENSVQWSEYTLRRVEVTRTIDGCKGHGNVVIEDSWLHDNTFATGAGTGAGGYTHGDGLQVSSGNNVVFQRNRVENWRGNSGVFVDPDQGTIANVTIAGNFFSNVGNYPIFIKESASNPSTGLPSNVKVTDNVIGARRTDTPADWGPMLCECRASGLIFTGNKTADGKEIKLGTDGKGYIV